MAADAPSFQDLMTRFPQSGRVEWIGLRPGRREPVVAVQTARAQASQGLHDDHYAGKSGKRQVTLIQAEHLAAVAAMMRADAVLPEQLRRNVVVSGLNLLALKEREFRVGGAVLEYTGLCHPCSYMEETLGRGGYNAMRGHGGITARVLADGEFAIGSPVQVLTD